MDAKDHGRQCIIKEWENHWHGNVKGSGTRQDGVPLVPIVYEEQLLDANEPADLNEEVERWKDQITLPAIYYAISEGTLHMLAEKEMAKEVWGMMKTMHMGIKRFK